MTQNVLLTKSTLGQVKPGFHVLPTSSHTYGKAPTKDAHGARDAISNWQFHKPSGVAQPPKDFMSINKQGVGIGLTNAKEISKFKDGNDTRVKVVEGKKFEKEKGQQSGDDVVFGIKNRPSTPIKNVICNTYAKESEEVAKEREAVMKMMDVKIEVMQEKVERKVGGKEGEKKHDGNVNRKQVIAENNFKLSKFSNVESKVKPMMEERKKKEKEGQGEKKEEGV